jgi:hypothetical protein
MNKALYHKLLAEKFDIKQDLIYINEELCNENFFNEHKIIWKLKTNLQKRLEILEEQIEEYDIDNKLQKLSELCMKYNENDKY